jgi:CRISPR-associated endoribonuclease Cas6
MPTRFRIAFEPLRAFSRPVVPADIHRLACYLLEPPGRDAHEHSDKNFSVMPLMTDDEVGALVGHQPDTIAIEICQLDDDPSAAERLQFKLDERPNLGLDHPLRCVELNTSTQTFAQLARGTPAHAADVEFLSPTHFSRSGLRYCLPDPMLVHRSLTRRWNSALPEGSPLAISEESIRSVNAAVVLTELDVVSVASGRRPDGFVGRVRFEVLGAAALGVPAVFAALWRFAAFSGVGALTTQGYGAVEVVLLGESGSHTEH